jgi:hypothetical protein
MGQTAARTGKTFLRRDVLISSEALGLPGYQITGIEELAGMPALLQPKATPERQADAGATARELGA